MQVKLLDLQAQYTPLREEIRAAVDEVFDAQALTLGPAVEKFEKSLAAYCGTKYALGVTSGTDALLCVMMAMDIGPGDEVIVPAFTFFCTAGCVSRLGATPVFVDIDPRTFNMDLDALRKAITPRTKAVIPVHLFGQCANVDAINVIACEHEIYVIEDAAQAIGAKRNGKPACSMGYTACLSFYPTKNLGAFGDAGAICTNFADHYEKCRLLRVHGSGHQYYHTLIGGMFRMAGVQGAVLGVKLKYLDQWHAARRKNAALYDQLLAGSPVVTPYIEPANWSIYNQYVVRVKNRDAVKQKLADAGITTAIYYPLPLHLQPCYKSMGLKEGAFPASELASKEVLALPIYPELPEEHLRYVAKMLLAATA